MRPVRPLVLSALCALMVLPSLASADDLKRFISPSRNIGCFGDAQEVRCDIGQTSATPPKRPRSCQFDWGDSFFLHPAGKARGFCHSDSALPDPNENARVLAYGTSIKLGRKMRCTSRRTGLTCRSTAGHGFTLSRTVIKLF
jgi:hypothetical protein